MSEPVTLTEEIRGAVREAVLGAAALIYFLPKNR